MFSSFPVILYQALLLRCSERGGHEGLGLGLTHAGLDAQATTTRQRAAARAAPALPAPVAAPPRAGQAGAVPGGDMGAAAGAAADAAGTRGSGLQTARCATVGGF